MYCAVFLSYLLICIVIEHDVNIAAKQCFSCTNALCYLSTQSLWYHKLRIVFQLEGVNSSGAAWRSRSLTMEWNDQGCLVGGRTVACVRLQLCAWLQQIDHLHYITMQISVGFTIFSVLLWSSIFVIESQCCLCKSIATASTKYQSQLQLKISIHVTWLRNFLSIVEFFIFFPATSTKS